VLSFKELKRAVRVLEAHLRGHRVQAVSQPDPTTLVLTVHGHRGDGSAGRRHLVLSCRDGYARVGIAPKVPAKLPTPPAFTQYLRAHALNTKIVGFRLLGEDRELAIRLRGADGDHDLLLAIFGRRSNIVLLDVDGCIVAAMRPLADTRPELALGEPWASPASRAPAAGSDRFAGEADVGYLEAIEVAYAAKVEEDVHARMRQSIERAIRKQHKALDRKLEKIARSLADAEQSVGLERSGELLKSVLSKVQRGDSEVVADDFSTGEPVVIPLDSKLSPKENLAKMFKRYQKAVRVLTKAGAQHAEVKAARDAAANLGPALEAAAADAESLEEFAARTDVARLLAKYEPRQGRPPSRATAATEVKLGKRSVPLRLAPRRYPTAGGLEIWVGRNDAGNDFLTTRLAAGNDLFFHLDGAPGSHVVLRTSGRKDPPSEAILDACELSIHYSKAKNATRADIHVVPIKNVKKPKGAKPGLVTVHGGKTVHLRRMQTRLERILAARIESDA
jgi:predicted ribosome quality control (RQC) complex YloA/Tae2 family protein